MIGSYETSKTLGTGAFGTVVLAKKQNSEKLYAIKSISKKNIIRSQMASQVKKEISIMKSLEHPNIVQIYEVLSSSEYLYIVMDYVPGGELYTKIARGGKLTNNECRRYTRQLCRALHYCHSKNVCHRDIKPQNILLDANDNVLLADFGFASIMEVEELQNNNTSFVKNDVVNEMDLSNIGPNRNRSMEGPSRIMKNMSTVCGTMSYMAPEISSRERYTGDKADIWSMGIVIYVLLVGFMPFKESDTEKNKFTTPSYMTRDAHHFISSMLTLDPSKRYSARKLLNHRWLSEMEDIPETVSLKEDSSDSEEQDDDEEPELICSDFTSIIPKEKYNDILQVLSENMKEDGWNVRIINGALRGSKMSLTGMVAVSIEVVGETLEVRNANITRDANVSVMNELSSLIKKVT